MVSSEQLHHEDEYNSAIQTERRKLIDNQSDEHAASEIKSARITPDYMIGKIKIDTAC